MDLSTLSIQVNVTDQNYGWTPILSIATSKDSTEWIELSVTNYNDWWRWYGYTGDIEYIPAGPIYIKVSPSGAGDNCAITQPSYSYSEYIPAPVEPTPADKEIIFISDGGVGNVIYKMSPTKAIDLSSLRITCNVNDTNNGWTPKMLIATSKNATEWIELDVDTSNPWGWRYYTYSGSEKSLPAGDIYIKLGASGSGLPDTIASASYEYAEYVELGDGDTVVSYYRGPGNTVHRADAANEVNLKEFKFICNVNDLNFGWTPEKIYIAKSLASDATWYELDCTYSDADNGWRHYTYSGSDVTISAGTFFIKLGASGKSTTDSDFITQSYYTYSNQTIGDLNEDGVINILDLVRADSTLDLGSFEYLKKLDMDHNAANTFDDFNLLRQFLLKY